MNKIVYNHDKYLFQFINLFLIDRNGNLKNLNVHVDVFINISKRHFNTQI